MANKIQKMAPFCMPTVICFMYVKMATGLHCEQTSGLLNPAE